MMEKVTSKNIGMGIKIILILLIACFFLPMCTVSCSGVSEEITGVETTLGLEIYGEKIEGNLFCGLLVLIPVVLLILTFAIKNQHNLVHSNIIGALINIVILVVYKMRISKLAEENWATVKFEFGYYLEFALNILLIVLAILLKNKIQDQVKVLTEEEMNKRGWIFISLYALCILAIILAVLFLM